MTQTAATNPMAIQILGMILSGVVSVLVALISSNGFWNRVEKKDGIKDSLETIKSKQEIITDRQEQMAAEQSRVEILRFNEELIQGQRHTRELFDIILGQIDKYEDYCEEHPKFPNSKCVLAIENIKECYKKCEKDGDFL